MGTSGQVGIACSLSQNTLNFARSRYLKGAAGRGKTAYTEGFSHYCKQGAGIVCEGEDRLTARAGWGVVWVGVLEARLCVEHSAQKWG